MRFWSAASSSCKSWNDFILRRQRLSGSDWQPLGCRSSDAWMRLRRPIRPISVEDFCDLKVGAVDFFAHQGEDGGVGNDQVFIVFERDLHRGLAQKNRVVAFL